MRDLKDNKHSSKFKAIRKTKCYDSDDSDLEYVINDISNKLTNEDINYNGNAIIYNRISSKKQNDGASLDSQLEICQKYCEEKKFKVIKYVREVASAKQMKYQVGLLNLINESSDTNLIIFRPDRLSRNFYDFVDKNKTLDNKKIIIHCVQENLNSSNPNDLLLIRSRIQEAEWDNKRKSEKSKSSIKKSKANGTYHSTIPPFGYKYVKEIKNGKLTKKLVENINEQLIIKLVKNLNSGKLSVTDLLIEKLTGKKYDLYFPKDEKCDELQSGNLTYKFIADFLNSIEIKRRSCEWNAKSVKKVIDMKN
jgi:DNA invertase Pin-like site-specific DNA recombinase